MFGECPIWDYVYGLLNPSTRDIRWDGFSEWLDLLQTFEPQVDSPHAERFTDIQLGQGNGENGDHAQPQVGSVWLLNPTAHNCLA